jgi:DNA-binding protein Fis
MSLAHADYAKVKVTGSIATTFFKTPTTDQKKRALEDARKNALDKYIAGLDSERVQILNNMIDQLRQNLTIYVPQVVAR